MSESTLTLVSVERATPPVTQPATPSSRPAAYRQLFVAVDAVPTGDDLATTAPPDVVASAQLTVRDVADAIGYEPSLVRRAVGAGPYHEDDLRRLYWRTRKLWDFDRDALVEAVYATRYGKDVA